MIHDYRLLQVETTSDCNAACEICLRPHLKRPIKHLSFGEFKKIIDSNELDFVGIHGWGESLLNPEIFAMIRYAESKGIVSQLTTNGLLVSENLDNIIDSGLSEIAFGIYTATMFLKREEAIRELVNAKKSQSLPRPITYLDTTLFKNNMDQVPQLIRLAAAAGIDAFILHPLFNAYGVDSSLEYPSEKEQKKLFQESKRLADSLKIAFYPPPQHSRPCVVIQHSLFVTAEGRFTPCCFLYNLSLGDAFKDDISGVKNSATYREFLRNQSTHPICNKCRW
jgi:MoaA/NifB/PqqE/SkfB family radical SAM enzyme